MGNQMEPIWEQALAVPCDRCYAEVGEWCSDASGKPVTLGNGPHSARLDRARGGYAWRALKSRVARQGLRLMPGPSFDGPIT